MVLLSSIIETMSQDKRDADELFDQALLSALRLDVVPHLGHVTVPGAVITQFVKVLAKASQICAPDADDPESIAATTQNYPTVPRERFAYSCFDLLFELCSDIPSTDDCKLERVQESRRVGAIALLPLIMRCRSVLSTFVADEELRGSIPFSRSGFSR